MPRGGVTLFGRHPDPPRRLGIVLGDTPTRVVPAAQLSLRDGVSLLRLLA